MAQLGEEISFEDINADEIKENLKKKVILENRSLLTPEERRAEIAVEVSNFNSDNVLKGGVLGKSLLDGSEMKHLDFIDKDVASIEGSTKEKVELLGQLLAKEEKKLLEPDTVPIKNEDLGKKRDEQQEKVVKIKAALLEMGAELMEKESPDLETGFSAIKLAGVNLDRQEPVWATKRIARALEGIANENEGKLPDSAVEILAGIDSFSLGLGTNAVGDYNGSSENLAKVAAFRQEAITRVAEIRAREEERNFRESWETNSNKGEEKYFNLATNNSRNMMEGILDNWSRGFGGEEGSHYLRLFETKQFNNMPEYVRSLASIDDSKIAEMAKVLAGKKDSYLQDVADRTRANYERFYGADKAEVEWEKQLAERIKREVQGHLMFLAMATFDARNDRNLVFGNEVVRETALKALGKGKMLEILTGKHPDKFLNKKLLEYFKNNKTVYEEFMEDDGLRGMNAFAMADMRYEEDEVAAQKNRQLQKEKDQIEAGKKEKALEKLRGMKEEVAEMKTKLQELVAMELKLNSFRNMDSATFFKDFIEVEDLKTDKNERNLVIKLKDAESGATLTGPEDEVSKTFREEVKKWLEVINDPNKRAEYKGTKDDGSFIKKYSGYLKAKAFEVVPYRQEGYNERSYLKEALRAEEINLKSLEPMISDALKVQPNNKSSEIEQAITRLQIKKDPIKEQIEKYEKELLKYAVTYGQRSVKVLLQEALRSQGRVLNI